MSGPQEILRIDVNETSLQNRYIFLEDNLKAVCNQIPEQVPVEIISTFGNARWGKSTLLNFAMLLAEYHEQNDLDLTEIVGAEIWATATDISQARFTSKRGDSGITRGIWLSQPLIVTKNDDRRVLLFMDTQGIFDELESGSEDDKVLFTFSAIVSSTLIYNLKGAMGNVLEEMYKFVSFGKRASQTSATYQKLVFLLRDWTLDESLGWDEHADSSTVDEDKKKVRGPFLASRLEVKANQTEEVKAFRQNLLDNFESLSCCRLPFPGRQLTKDQYGSYEPDFVTHIHNFLTDVLKTAEPRRLDGTSTITSSGLFSLFSLLFEKFRDGETLEAADSYFQLTAKLKRIELSKQLLRRYRLIVKEIFREFDRKRLPQSIEREDHDFRQQLLNEYKAAKANNMEQQELKAEMDESFVGPFAIFRERRARELQSLRQKYHDIYTKTLMTGRTNNGKPIDPEVYNKKHQQFKNEIYSKFMTEGASAEEAMEFLRKLDADFNQMKDQNHNDYMRFQERKRTKLKTARTFAATGIAAMPLAVFVPFLIIPAGIVLAAVTGGLFCRAFIGDRRLEQRNREMARAMLNLENITDEPSAGTPQSQTSDALNITPSVNNPHQAKTSISPLRRRFSIAAVQVSESAAGQSQNNANASNNVYRVIQQVAKIVNKFSTEQPKKFKASLIITIVAVILAAIVLLWINPILFAVIGLLLTQFFLILERLFIYQIMKNIDLKATAWDLIKKGSVSTLKNAALQFKTRAQQSWKNLLALLERAA